MKHLTALIILVLFFASLQGEILTSGERQLIVDQLSKADLQENDMNFLKDWVASTYFKLPAVVNVLNNPLELPVLAEDLKSSVNFGDTALFNYLQQYVTQYSIPIDFDVNYYALELKENVRKPMQLFDFVQDFYEMADPYMNKALKELTPTDKEILRKFAFTSFMEREDSLKYQQLFTDMDIRWGKQDYDVEDMIELQAVIAKVDLPSLMEAGYIIHLCAELIKDNYLFLEFPKAKPISIETKWGWMAFGSPKDDNYNGAYSFIFEPGGNDNYYDITSPVNPFQIVIDGKGNDQYAGTKVASLFGSQFSVTIGYDLKGNDVYRGDDFSFASFFGYQYFEDSYGDDIYRGEVYSLASASYGVSIIRDRRGDDRYSTAEYGEGFGSTLGFGTIMDMDGDDFYLAGGKHLHAPLAPFDYLCMAQGFGFGVRPDYAGGIGLLYDRDGNDSYQGGVYSQAGGYWYALGMLLDDKGNDFYNSVYYPQGTGIHLAAGFLWDGAGEDSYYSKHGPGQGAGHDYGVGFLIDRGGDDHYSIEGGNGLGLTNSVGVFLDVNGNDRYERQNNSSYGYANTARDAGGIGIFLDLQGKDYYANKGTKDDSTWVAGKWGIGLDTLSTVVEQKAVEQLADEVAEVDSLASVEELFAIACEWEVGSAVERVKKARKYLLKQEVEATKYITENAMATKSGLTFRAIYDFAKNSDLFKLTFDMGFESEDSLVVKNYISLTGSLADTTHTERLKQFLAEKKYVPSVLSTIGSLKTKESLSILEQYINSPSEKIRFTVAANLKHFGSEKSAEILHLMKDDESFLVRSLVRIFEESKVPK